MSIARGLTKAVKAAKKQSRGLTGNRNSQGDFMAEYPGREMARNIEGVTPEQLKELTTLSTEDLNDLAMKLEKELDNIKSSNYFVDEDTSPPEDLERISRLQARLNAVDKELDTRGPQEGFDDPELANDRANEEWY
jgi:hypothetical protein